MEDQWVDDRFVKDIRETKRINIKHWIELFTNEGIFKTERKKNPDPNRPYTSGFLPPLPSWFAMEKIAFSKKELWQAALILIIDSFTKQKHSQWISMSMLKKLFGQYYGLKTVEELLSWGQKEKILQVKSIEYQGDVVKNAYVMNFEHPFVQKVLETKKQILQILRASLIDRETLGLEIEVFIEKLEEKDLSEERRELYMWLAILGNIKELWFDNFGKVVNLYYKA